MVALIYLSECVYNYAVLLMAVCVTMLTLLCNFQKCILQYVYFWLKKFVLESELVVFCPDCLHYEPIRYMPKAIIDVSTVPQSGVTQSVAAGWHVTKMRPAGPVAVANPNPNRTLTHFQPVTTDFTAGQPAAF